MSDTPPPFYSLIHWHATPRHKPRPRASYKDVEAAAERWETLPFKDEFVGKVTSRLALFPALALISPTIRLLSTAHKAPLLPRLAAIHLSPPRIYLHKAAAREAGGGGGGIAERASVSVMRRDSVPETRRCEVALYKDFVVDLLCS